MPFIDGEPKVYEATITFGAETDTDDSTGSVVRDAPPPNVDAVDRAIVELTGPLDQVPPAYSAKQSGGVRAYAAARSGQPLELRPARVIVHRWRILGRDAQSLVTRIECSGGTYIRSLGRDLGRLAGSAAHVSALRRLSSGCFHVRDATSVEALRERRFSLIDMRAGVPSLPAQPLTEGDLARVSNGNSVDATIQGPRAALLAPDGSLAAIANRDGDRWRPATVFSTHD